jgi:serine/threonine protein kinase
MQRVNHPNIAKLYDVIETDTQVILVMEYISGDPHTDIWSQSQIDAWTNTMPRRSLASWWVHYITYTLNA